MIAECGPGVLSAESTAALQDWYDMVDERRQLLGQRRSHDGESVDGACVLPSDHVCGELLRCSDEMALPRATGHVLSDVAQGSVGPGTRGREEVLSARRRSRLLGPEPGGQRSVGVETARVGARPYTTRSARGTLDSAGPPSDS